MHLKFLHGLDDDMREQALQEFWQKNKNFIFLGFGVLFLSYGLAQFYKVHQQRVVQEQAFAYYNAVQESTPEAYKKLAKNAAPGFKGLALFQAAQGDAKAGDIPAALAAYEALRSDGSVPPLWRDLATIFQGELLLTADAQKGVVLLRSLIETQSPYARSAYELLAVDAQNKGQYAEAASYYEHILALANLPGQMRQAIEVRLGYLKGQGLLKHPQGEAK